MITPCDAGRRAFFGGRWTVPCEDENDLRHVIASAGSPHTVELCDDHFMQVNAYGLVTESFLTEAQFTTRYKDKLRGERRPTPAPLPEMNDESV